MSVRACACYNFGQAVIKWAITDGFWISRCLKKRFDIPVQMALSKVAPLASMVVKNGTKKTFQQIVADFFH